MSMGSQIAVLTAKARSNDPTTAQSCSAAKARISSFRAKPSGHGVLSLLGSLRLFELVGFRLIACRAVPLQGDYRGFFLYYLLTFFIFVPRVFRECAGWCFGWRFVCVSV